MKQCGNINGRPKPTPYLNPSRSLTKLNKKRKRARSQKAYRTKRATPRRRSRRPYASRRRKRGRPRLSARGRGSRQRRSESSSLGEEASSSSGKRPCRSMPNEKKSDDDGGEASMNRSHSGSDRNQETRPVTSKHKSLDASQMNHSIEKWDITMAQAAPEPPLQAQQQGCGSPSPRSRCSSGGAREGSQEKPQSSPHDQGLVL